ncbi:uncharacterized protein LOC135848246 [Planococcus citri]|uniref:uncharacterized protein LOC135848246 n=1 Tax=Planococcus citri TaxID=170843 RepID=UPI0031F9D37A
MKLLSSFSIFVVLATFTAPIFSHADRFEELFESEAPIKEVFMELINTNPATNYIYFQQVLQHANTKNDKLAPYAKKLIDASQKILDHLLNEVNYQKKVDIVKFVNSAFQLMTTSSNKNSEMMKLMQKLNEYMEKTFEDALEEAKKNIMERLLSVVDDGSKTIKIQDVSEAKESPKKPNPKPKRSKSSATGTQKDSNASSRKLRRSQISKVPSNKDADA